MKKQTFQFPKTNSISYLVCLFCLAFMLAGCESQSDEVQPLGAITENTDEARMGMKGMPHHELAMLRAAVARYHNFEHAIADGYDLELTKHVSGMGFHYVKTSLLLDGQFDVEHPEALLYIEGPNGKMRFVGVEYAIPIADMSNIPPAPEGFSGDLDVWAVNRTFEIWTLHAWVGLDNPNGIFAPRNPRVH